MPISYNCEDCKYVLENRRAVDAMIRRCVTEEGRKLTQLNIIFCPDDYLLEINRKYLGHNYYTDVITFDYGIEDYLPADKSDPRAQQPITPHVCGDIYISIDTVAQNAAKYGVSATEEMHRVIIHGVLHLCGYNDTFPVEQSAMTAKENHYLHGA